MAKRELTVVEQVAKQDRDLRKLVSRLARLPLGEIVSYAELCVLLGEKELAGDSRIRQYDEWNTYMVLEKVGRKFCIKQVYDPSAFSFANKFATDEQHLAHSCALLHNYLAERYDVFDKDEKFHKVASVILFSKDIASICGYIHEDYFSVTRAKLLEGSLDLRSVTKCMQMYIAGTLKTSFSNLLRYLIASLDKKKVVRIEEVLIGFTKGSTKQYELSTAAQVMYFTVEQQYYDKYHKGKRFGAKIDSKIFHRMLKAEGIEYDKVYKGYKFTFSDYMIHRKLESKAYLQAVLNNRKHFKDKLMAVVTKDSNKVTTQLQVNPNAQGFLHSTFYAENILEQFDWIVEELLNYGEIRTECPHWVEPVAVPEKTLEELLADFAQPV